MFQYVPYTLVCVNKRSQMHPATCVMFVLSRRLLLTQVALSRFPKSQVRCLARLWPGHAPPGLCPENVPILIMVRYPQSLPVRGATGGLLRRWPLTSSFASRTYLAR